MSEIYKFAILANQSVIESIQEFRQLLSFNHIDDFLGVDSCYEYNYCYNHFLRLFLTNSYIQNNVTLEYILSEIKRHGEQCSDDYQYKLIFHEYVIESPHSNGAIKPIDFFTFDFSSNDLAEDFLNGLSAEFSNLIRPIVFSFFSDTLSSFKEKISSVYFPQFDHPDEIALDKEHSKKGLIKECLKYKLKIGFIYPISIYLGFFVFLITTNNFYFDFFAIIGYIILPFFGLFIVILFYGIFSFFDITDHVFDRFIYRSSKKK